MKFKQLFLMLNIFVLCYFLHLQKQRVNKHKSLDMHKEQEYEGIYDLDDVVQLIEQIQIKINDNDEKEITYKDIEPIIQQKSTCNPQKVVESDMDICLSLLGKIDSLIQILSTKQQSNLYKYLSLTHEILTIPVLQSDSKNLTRFTNTRWISKQPILDTYSSYLESFKKGETQCPFSQPFYNGRQCIQCQDKMVYSFFTKKCQSCSYKEYYNSYLHTCSLYSDIFITMPTVFRLTGGNIPQYYDYQSKLLREHPGAGICPLDKPFSIDYKCIACEPPFDIFNITSKSCISCPQPAYFDEIQFKCTGYATASNRGYLSKIIGGKQLENSEQDIECLAQTPFFTGTQCISCDSIFNPQTKECTSCGKKTYFQPTTQMCENSPPNASNPSVKIRIQGYSSLSSDDITCPEEKPFYDGLKQKCIGCQKPAFYFNSTSFECYIPLANGTNPNVADRIVNGKIEQSEGQNQNQNAIYCDNQEPFFNGKECIDCIFPESLFDLKNLQCVSPPPNATNPLQEERVFGSLPKNQKYLIYCQGQNPFFDDQKCINCFHPQSFFNLTSLECVKGNPNMTNPKYLQFVVGEIMPNQQYDYFCPQEKPYFSENTCISCIFPYSLFNAVSLDCQKPPVNGSNPSVFDRIVGGREQTNQFTISCEIDNPFFTGQECINCEHPYYLFNLRENECYKLPPNKTNPYYYNSSLDPSQLQQNDVYCPIQTPFYNPQKDECIYCDKDMGYNFNQTSYQCTLCGLMQVFNITKRKCVSSIKKLSQLSAPWTSNYPFKSTVELQEKTLNSGFSVCPTQLPFYDGSQCIICPENLYFNMDSSICVECKQGTQYKENYKRCVLKEQYFLSNLFNGDFLYSDVSQAQWQAKFEKIRSQNSQISYCPQQQPYYDGEKCKKCLERYPHFDLLLKDCVFCPQGTREIGKQCINNDGQAQSPSIQKLAASVFSHKKARHKLHLKDIKT